MTAQEIAAPSNVFVSRSGRPFELAAVMPDNYGTPSWIADRAAFVGGERDEAWADAYLRLTWDRADLRALGFCRDCGASGRLLQAGACVYFGACGCYRAQGDVRNMQPYLDDRLAAITPERRAALLALFPVSTPVSHETGTP